MVGDVIIGFFAEPLTRDDAKILHIPVGSPEAQQVAEAMAILIALRLWFKFWANGRVRLEVRSDSTVALIVTKELKGRSYGLRLVAAEIAIDIANASYEPDLFTHTPGVQNTLADLLSRRFQPKAAFKLPPTLQEATWCHPPARDQSWWKTLSPKIACAQVLDKVRCAIWED